jgi:peptidoglycan/LPS O-acetylase OafA/YrhL
LLKRVTGDAQTAHDDVRTHRRDIDGLRAVAIFGVLAYHFKLGGVTGGYGGVDVFFVISGFLIAGLIKCDLDTGSFSISEFYVRRIRRILPALLVCTLATTVIAAIILFPSDFYSFGKSLRALATMTSNFYFKQATGYFDTPAIDKPLLHTWSLSIEEQFYAVFPCVLIVLQKFKPKAIIPVLASAAFGSLAYSVVDVALHPTQAFFSTWGRIWELLIGGLIAYGAVPCTKGRLLRETEAAIGAAAIAVVFFIYTDATRFPGLAAVPLCLGAAMIIHSGAASQTTYVARCLSSAPAVGLGLISYSVYLWHWPLMVFFRYRLGQESWQTSSQLLLVAASIALGFLSYRFVEQPVRRSQVIPPQLAFGSVAASISVLFALSQAILQKSDWFQRWTPEVATLSSPPLPRGESLCTPLPNAFGGLSETCRLGTANVEPDTLLWGDSHARQLAAGLAAYDPNIFGHAVLVETYGGCPPLAGVTLYARNNSLNCRPFNDSVVEKVRSSTTIKRVIIAARWALYAEGLNNSDDSGEVIYLSKGGLAKNPEIFADRLEATIKLLSDQGRQVIIVGPVPENVINPARALARFKVWGASLPPETRLAEFLTRERNVMPVLAKVGQLPNVRLLYPHLKLCDDDICHSSRGGEVLYRDGNHLNDSGLAKLSNIYSEIFAAPSGPVSDTAALK